MWLCRAQLGTYLDIYLQTTDANRVATMPDYVPWLKIWQGSTLVLAHEMPLVDKDIQVGLFCERLFLGAGFTTGQYAVQMSYQVAHNASIESRTFAIIPGGHADGSVMGIYWYHRPHADFLVYQLEAGKIARGKEPRTN